MSTITTLLEGTIDFRGQVMAETVTQVGIISSAILAFAVGYALQSFEILLLVFGGGVVLTLLAVLPPWPMYNRHPVQWLKTTSSSSVSSSTASQKEISASSSTETKDD
ncbi:hypothetical protein IWQ62_005056 [Dispira parvispora]|uniref:Signal peptidase complex subunit 1 n=1 Tax=Dispira parvispora TaxID=1520584 RepID=A0A9W8E4V3_9FUNG|nr:hypothetical protein IWQ62_005056 [Dispira parvispora]